MSGIKLEQQTHLLDGTPLEKQGASPTTRYQGSKHKILDWIDHCTRGLVFDSVVDAFGGTGCVSHLFKKRGKQVFYNDSLRFNYHIGHAIIENNDTVLRDSDIDFIMEEDPGVRYPTFIRDTFKDIYFTDEENRWLDIVVTNIRRIENRYRRSLASYALFQACIIKRPYNLFHRKNLYIRTADVERSFGNKKTWDTPFEAHFRKFAKEGNRAVFDNGQENRALNSDALDLDTGKDLVYIDTPYISQKGVGVNYLDFYHFLEGMTSYDTWTGLIDETSKHKKMQNGKNAWCDRHRIHDAFRNLFERYRDSILVVSYRDNGIPTVDELVAMLKERKTSVGVNKIDYRYVLSNGNSKEVLIIAR